MKFVYFFLLLGAPCFYTIPVFAQNTGVVGQSKSVNQVQPVIIIVPFTKEGRTIREVLEEDVTRRVAITKVKEAFDMRGFSTVDFLARLRATDMDRPMTGDTLNDVKKQIIELSGADIYVDVEVAPLTSKSGNSVRLILTAYDAFTGVSLANKTGSSPKFYTEDYGKLVERALEEETGPYSPPMLEDFLNVIQTKFTDIVENGRFIKIQFNLSPDASFDLEDEFGPQRLPLSDILEEWMAENAFKSYYHIQGATPKILIFDKVRIPSHNESGKNYTPTRFALQLMQFCSKLEPVDNPGTRLQVKRDVRGGTIYITIQ